MTLLSQKYLPTDSAPNIADIGDVAGYTHLLLMLSRIPADNTAAPDPRELAMAMRRWSDSIRSQMPHYAPSIWAVPSNATTSPTGLATTSAPTHVP